jgi:hypothetical protein
MAMLQRSEFKGQAYPFCRLLRDQNKCKIINAILGAKSGGEKAVRSV